MFSSSGPVVPAMLMVRQEPMTRAAAWIVISSITGFTLPGHDGAARLERRQRDFSQTGPRTA